MDFNNFTKQMIGTWITQSTYYSSFNISETSCHFVNRVRWLSLKNNIKYLKLMSKKNEVNLLQKNIYLYHVQLNNHRKKNNDYYLALKIDQSNRAYLLKFDASFNLINQFFIKEITENYLCLSTYVNNYEILQKIYFLNQNVKLIKVTINKQHYHIGTSFLSEIRIS